MIFLYLVVISVFNALYKYVSVKNNLSEYSYNANFLNSFKTTSSVSVSYINIFIVSLIIVIVLNIILIIILKVKSNSSLKDTIKSLSVFLVLTVFAAISTCLLFLSITASIIVLLLGIVIFLSLVYRRFDRLSFVLITISIIITAVALYFIVY